MKLCYSTLGCVSDSLEANLHRCAAFGISALEIRGLDGVLRHGRIGAWNAENATSTKEAFRSAGVTPLVLGTSCAFHDPAVLPGAIAEGLEALEIADRFSIPYLRLFGNNITADRQACYDRVISGIKALCDAAKGTGVNMLLEVHGDYNTIEALTPIAQALGDRENFGLIWDIAHTHAPYGERWEEFYTFARPLIRHIHIKDRDCKTSALTLTGKGDLPILPICRRLLRDGYDGYFSLEWERQWVKTLPPIDEALSHFTALMAEV